MQKTEIPKGQDLQDLGEFKIFRDGPRKLEKCNKMRYLKIYELLKTRTRFKS